MNIEIKEPKLVDILKEREELAGKIAAINKTQLDMEKDKTKLGYRMDRLKEKTQVIVEKQQIEVPQYHVLTRIYLEDGKAMAEIVDQIDEYKKFLDDKKAK